ncbi:hypothetical protein CLPUN_50040 [Clostridium puniceum]|uniref:SHSP domain-containing protein n=1 Tax=Clostridium puniceum TaxID=29367 RepID=A0A1S8T0Z9_9CLOT|nr:hypothetical protein [Clostridium puniceum]OOM71274.1 hypothetical protein CLPUN_50040 [Clostridium puniceum]
MKDNSLIYDNFLIQQKDFINQILHPVPKEELPEYEIKETSEFYYININSFHGSKHILDISTKNDFLILKIKFKNTQKKSSLERIFYLLNIDLNNILLHDYNHNLKLIIPKIN